MAEPLTLGFIHSPLVDQRGMVTSVWLRRFREYEQKLQSALNILGEIAASAKISGRTEGIGTTVSQLTSLGEISAVARLQGRAEAITTIVSQLNSAGLLADADKVAADGSTFKRVTDAQRTGGGLARVALDDNARLANSQRLNPVDATAVPLAATVLSNDGVATAIPVAANSQQFGGTVVVYNAGSVDPGVFGTFWIFADDPTFAGGAVTYQFSTTPGSQASNIGRVQFGKITTVAATAKTGGGNTGGTTPGGAGGRGYALA